MTPRPYMKIIFKKGEVKELEEMILKHFTMDGPILYGSVLTQKQMEKELNR